MEATGGNPAAVVAALRDGTFPRLAWDHRAHLVACWAVDRELMSARRSSAEVIDAVRTLIVAYNARTAPSGTAAGCHETITRYYVEAVTRLHAGRPDDLVDHPWCRADAPTRHWSPPLLWSETARTSWVAPDLGPLPWASGPTGEHHRYRTSTTIHTNGSPP